MSKKILILSSDVTGHGHKSITESLLERFADFPEINVKVVDGFSLMGSLGLKIGKMYGSITRTSKDAWKHIWDITEKRPSLIIEMSELSIQDRFIKLLDEFKPDGIITTHPNFNASATNILSRLNLKIPFFAVIADPVTISPLWCNPDATWTICPTGEAKEACLKAGVSAGRITVSGFPVRQRFTKHLNAAGPMTEQEIENSVRAPAFPIQFMIISGGEGSGNMSRQARILLKNFNCRVRLLCGRNKLLKRALEHTLAERYKDRVEILGFTENVQDLMLETGIMFTRASPNTMMEAIMCNVPLVITGALPGQEEGNPAFALKHGIGVVCTRPAQLMETVSGLLTNNCEKLIQMKKSQIRYRNPNGAKNITDFVISRL